MADDTPDGHASEAAQQADAVDEVERNTKSQTSAASYTTQDPDVVRAWVEARGGVPAAVASTTDDGQDDAGLLRVMFPDAPDDAQDNGELTEVGWDEFLETFRSSGLSFVYQEQTSDGSTSRFNRFVREDG